MRVVYVVSLTRGGPLSHVRDLAPQVAATGVDVKVICPDGGVAEGFLRAGLETKTIPLRHKLDVVNAARLRRALKGADVVHTHDRRTGLLARPQALVVGARSVHTLHGVPEEIFMRTWPNDGADPPGVSRLQIAWLRHGLLRIEALLSYLGSVVVPSHALTRFLVGHGFPRDRLHVIPYGIAAQTTGVHRDHEPVVVGTASILKFSKGVDMLLEACSRVVSPIRLEIFGDGSERGALERRARTLGLDPRFHGFVPNMRARMREIDLFVLPTRADNLPVAIMEAMASGLPVVATRVGGIPELVVDGETGVLVEPDDPDGMARALENLVQDPDRRAAMGQAGMRRIAEEFDAAQVAERMVRLYEELCASSM